MSLVVDGKAWETVGEDEEEVQGFKMPITFSPVFDGDKSIAYVTGMFERQRVICNDEAQGEFTWVSNLQFDKQGELCYLAMGQAGPCLMRGGKLVYEVDGISTSMDFTGISSIALAMDGVGNTALIASRDKVDELFVNGESVGIVGEHLESDDRGNRKTTELQKSERGTGGRTTFPGMPEGLPEGAEEAMKNAKVMTGLVRVIHIVWTGTAFRAVGIKDGKLTVFEYKP
jgi:hypothetical protein